MAYPLSQKSLAYGLLTISHKSEIRWKFSKNKFSNKFRLRHLSAPQAPDIYIYWTYQSKFGKKWQEILHLMCPSITFGVAFSITRVGKMGSYPSLQS